MKHLFLLAIILLSITAKAQTIIGQWETFDDKTKEKKAVIEIYKTNNLYFAKIIENFIGENNALCENCKGQKKDKPIIGLVIIENIKKSDNEYSGGAILDPESGETYSCYLELIDNNKLKVRGFIGFSLFGRTQYWTKRNKNGLQHRI
ncbi:DUF2147 domain-containing protein [Maribacter antarcticus]|uniref:DUF2147 domain-containing protein n=1 Tax=Maribacter antarcticus TaxID=505250 RepID=UPI00047D6F59|nr:DUF2147 domain-containing protein [Maribacter antarcticus]